MSLSSTTIDTPVGEITIVAGPRGVRAVLFAVEEIGDFVAEPVSGDDPAATSIAADAARQLIEYFAGERHEFDLPLDPQGTPFQLSVWEVLRTIPYGKTISYGDQARQLGDVRKSRAVGAANGRNPLSIVVPPVNQADEETKAKRKAAKERKQADARARREQQLRARGR